ncbi:sigma factor-like helix-turn-helix DNA-binding protein [Lysinibacillus sp. NPDC093688]|uniref:sigma factor-like helix-turn-helix DNA-binding protein n=1 Tax=Lysinibacillus sp. NPDC093688 TaxID=3390577 RepID=UPI003D041069
MKKNGRKLDKLVEEYLKLYPYIYKEKVGTLTKNQMIAICISELLNIMPEKEVAFIKYRYLKGWTIVKVAQEMNYSQQMIYVIRKNALEKIFHGISHLLYSEEKKLFSNTEKDDEIVYIINKRFYYGMNKYI